MPDKYEIRKRQRHEWALHRVDDDPDFGFDKLVGVFRTKPELEHALERITLHKDRNFAEWLYACPVFRNSYIISQEEMQRRLYKRWLTIGAHLSVGQKRDLMNALADDMKYIIDNYEQKIEDLKTDHAMELAGEDW